MARGGSPFLLKAKAIEGMKEEVYHHPLNPISEVHIRSLGYAIDLQRVGFKLARVPKGKEPNITHAHHCEEAFFYILSGRGVAVIHGKCYSVGPGDFMAFPAPSVPHILKNTHEEDLIYLVGGERKRFEIAEFPTLSKMLFRDGETFSIADQAALKKGAVRWAKRGTSPAKSAAEATRGRGKGR